MPLQAYSVAPSFLLGSVFSTALWRASRLLYWPSPPPWTERRYRDSGWTIWTSRHATQGRWWAYRTDWRPFLASSRRTWLQRWPRMWVVGHVKFNFRRPVCTTLGAHYLFGKTGRLDGPSRPVLPKRSTISTFSARHVKTGHRYALAVSTARETGGRCRRVSFLHPASAHRALPGLGLLLGPIYETEIWFKIK